MNNKLTIHQYIKSSAVNDRVEELLKERANQFIISLTSLVSSDEKLSACDPKSIFTGALTAAAMNLPINNNLGYVYLIPYGNKAQLQFGYKAFIQLAQRSGQFKTINVTDVKEGEIKGVNRLSGEMEFDWQDDAAREKSITVGYVAYIKLINGFEKSLYMTVKELKAHGVKFSKTAKQGFGLWINEFDAMAKKTVLKLLLSKYAPLTTDMAKAQEADQALVTDKGFEYVDNKPVDPEEEAEIKETKRLLQFIEEAKTIEDLKAAEEAAELSISEEVSEAYKAKEKELNG